ncbi:MAG: RNA polymerase sigma factor [bacterium]|nr:MAG: RNA polymerase sigma factor [bacterium]
MNFTKLYKSHISPLTRFVFKRIGSDPQMADEIVLETFSSAWKGYKTFQNKSSFFTWLCRIALNKIADYYRDQINRRSKLVFPTLKKLSQIESKDIAIDEKLALDELRSKVNEVLDLLPPEKRRLLQFRYYRDLTYKEISVILQISPRAVEGKLYRAKKSFAEVFKKITSLQHYM